MKKVVIIILCALILSFASLSASAGAFELEAYGQRTVTLTEPFTPLVDGVIDEGEYELMIPAVLAEDETNDDFFIYGNTDFTDAEYVNFYISADDDNLYFAIEQKDPLRVGHYDALYLQIGATEDTGSYIQIYFPYNAGLEILSEGDRSRWTSYYDSFAASYSEDITLYEIAIPRKTIETVFGVASYDKLLVSLAHRVHYNADDGNVVVTWGFESAELEANYTKQSFPVYGYPHVLELYGVTENDTPSAESPEVPEIVVSETTEPESTPETEESTPRESESNPVTEPATDDGCGASVSTSVLALIFAPLAYVVLTTKKKHRSKCCLRQRT